MSRKNVKCFLILLIFQWTWLFSNQLIGSAPKMIFNIDEVGLLEDSITYKQIVENSPKETSRYLGIPYTDQAKFYLKHLKRQLRKNLKKNPDLSTKNIANDLVITQIEKSTLYIKIKEDNKRVLIILGILVVAFFIITSAIAVKNSN